MREEEEEEEMENRLPGLWEIVGEKESEGWREKGKGREGREEWTENTLVRGRFSCSREGRRGREGGRSSS